MGPLVALVAFGLGAGLADREIRVFEGAAARDIATQLRGGTVKVDVEPGLGAAWGEVRRATIQAQGFSVDGLPLFTEPQRSQAGRLGELRIELREFELRGLRVESLSARIPACRYDLGLARREKSIRLSRAGVGTGTVRVREADLAAFILRKFPEVKRVTVKVYNGIVWVEGYGEFLIVNSTFTVIARLAPIDGTKLSLTEAKIWFDWRRADPAAAKVLLDTLNPVVDFDRDLGLQDAILVDRVRLEGGVLEASGRTTVPVRRPPPQAPSSSTWTPLAASAVE